MRNSENIYLGICIYCTINWRIKYDHDSMHKLHPSCRTSCCIWLGQQWFRSSVDICMEQQKGIVLIARHIRLEWRVTNQPIVAGISVWQRKLLRFYSTKTCIHGFNGQTYTALLLLHLHPPPPPPPPLHLVVHPWVCNERILPRYSLNKGQGNDVMKDSNDDTLYGDFLETTGPWKLGLWKPFVEHLFPEIRSY